MPRADNEPPFQCVVVRGRTFGDGSDVDAGNVPAHVLAAHFNQRPRDVQLEIEELAAGEGDDDLLVVDGRTDDRPPGRRGPLGDALVAPDEADAGREHLHQRIIAHKPHVQRRRVLVEAGIYVSAGKGKR